MDQLAKKAAELALRLAAMSAEQLRPDDPRLYELDQLAMQIMTVVSAIRVGKNPSVGETRGVFRAAQSLTPQ